MKELKITLIGDGSSDKALVNIIKWLLNDLNPQLPTKIEYADFRNLPKPPAKDQILEQVKCAEKHYPFDILIYHRDAESNKKDIVELRKCEVFKSLGDEYSSKVICIVPIVMMETWLLISESAIKKAAGNRNYRQEIDLPSPTNLEKIKNPKEKLHDLLREVSGLKSRRLKNFNVHEAIHLVAENIDDFSLLRNLDSFKIFELDLKKIISSQDRQPNWIIPHN